MSSHEEIHCRKIRLSLRACALAAAFALGATSSMAQGGQKGGGGCHPVPPKAETADALGFYTAELTGNPLLPGGRRRTLGTNDTESPELQVEKHLLDRSTRFRLQTNEGLVEGILRQSVDRGTDHFCKCHWQISISENSPGCVASARIGNFDLGSLGVVADFRYDMNGTVRPRSATRTLDGLTYEFVFDPNRLLCAGMTSRWLLLNTEWDDEIGLDGVFQAIGPLGEEGQPVPAYAPVH